jgi:hypothetical protein
MSKRSPHVREASPVVPTETHFAVVTVPGWSRQVFDSEIRDLSFEKAMETAQAFNRLTMSTNQVAVVVAETPDWTDEE